MDTAVRPHAKSAALLTIDVQRDFTVPGAPAEIEGTAAAVPQMAALAEGFRSVGAPIIHVVRLYRPDGSNVDRCRREAIRSGADIVRPGSDGAELVADLTPGTDRLDADQLLDGEFQSLGPTEWAMYKPRWGAFFETDLEAFLERLGVDSLVVCGCNFPNCPRTTIYEASERDFRLVCVPDAMSGTYDRGLDELRNIGVAVWESEETLEWLADDNIE